MEYKINTHYPITELENISEWWKTHRDYDINEHIEPRQYDEKDNLLLRTYDDYVEIVPRDTELAKQNLRELRECECFSYINRGQLWYNTLTEEQKVEFQEWYYAWLDITKTLKVPVKPKWLK